MSTRFNCHMLLATLFPFVDTPFCIHILRVQCGFGSESDIDTVRRGGVAWPKDLTSRFEARRHDTDNSFLCFFIMRGGF